MYLQRLQQQQPTNFFISIDLAHTTCSASIPYENIHSQYSRGSPRRYTRWNGKYTQTREKTEIDRYRQRRQSDNIQTAVFHITIKLSSSCKLSSEANNSSFFYLAVVSVIISLSNEHAIIILCSPARPSTHRPYTAVSNFLLYFSSKQRTTHLTTVDYYTNVVRAW